MEVSEELREAGDVGTTSERLEELSRHENVEVRRAVAGNPNTPWGVLEGLMWEFPREFLHNPVGAIQMMARPEEMFAKYRLQSNLHGHGQALQSRLRGYGRAKIFMDMIQKVDDVPEEWVRWLWQHEEFANYPVVEEMYEKLMGEIENAEQWYGNRRVRRMLAKCEWTPGERLGALMNDRDQEVRVRLAENRRVSAEVLEKLAEDKNNLVRQSVARNKKAPSEILKILARDMDQDVRKNVAENTVTPANVLARLASDGQSAVRWAVMKNNQTPEGVLRQLADNLDWHASTALAQNSRLPLDVLDKLVRSGVVGFGAYAENEWTPSAHLRELAQDVDVKTRRAVASHANAPEDVLYELLKDPEWQVRAEVVLHPRLMQEYLWELEMDTAEEVRRRAKIRYMIRAHELKPVLQARDVETLAYFDWVESLVCTQEVRDILASLYRVRYFNVVDVMWRARLPETVLRECAIGRRQWEMRCMVAMHPEVPEDVLEELKKDEDRVVRAAARGVWR